jgi:hypothetical protein
MEVTRLLPTDDSSWLLFPAFKDRNRRFIETFLPSTKPDAIIDDLVKRWINTPLLTGYFLVRKDPITPIAHLTSWIADNYGDPYVFVYQAWCDEGHNLGKAAAEVVNQIDLWAKMLNAMMAETKSKITKFELSTWRDADVWARYFEAMGRKSVKIRSVIECELKV